MMLIIFGIIMIYSSSNIWAKYKFDDSFKYVKQQILFFIMMKEFYLKLIVVGLDMGIMLSNHLTLLMK